MSEYSEKELERMRFIERAMWLRDIEHGKVLTEKQFEAIIFFLGDMINEIKAIPTKSISIHFDKLGKAHSIDHDGIIESVNGRKL